ncbi:D-alanyl-D-alanine carboxypeptidase family protein [Promicromonospora vindobonensis]|uniref:D-alanyl-D-alanine carboxypeptidase family protein n=1 Tax=Promicromonospora vindobonensis TaxID=195748 RepID=A0ABW5VQP2_9MICO
MNDQAKKLVPHNFRTGLRRFLRPAWTGAVATVIAAGVLFTASASVPASHPSGGNDGELPIRLYGLIESVTVGETDSAPDGVTLSQIVAVLERAEEQAQEEGPNFSPTVAQAAAELGMLYTTYQMQQLAFGENNEGLRLEDAPVARHSQQADDDAADSDKEAGAEKGDDAGKRDGSARDGEGKGGAKQDGAKKNADTERDDSEQDTGPERGTTPHVPRPEDDAPPAVQVSNERTSVIDPHDEDPQAGYITYDEVVIAAVRLANMLDPSVPNALVEVEGEGQGSEQRRGFSLRESLLDVVSMFGGTTTGYANGRIPADVLCPLDFAPGHMLRCDAAERFTALSEQFEQEFGYPIPLTDSYRSYELQVAVASAKPHLAAIPGTSNHGWGIAVDLDNPIAGGNSPEYVWLRVHGPDYGWDNPSWAQLDGSKPEPWHFEFFAAGSIPNRAIDPSDVGTWEPTDSATPRYKPALDPKPKNGSSDDGPRKPGSKPGDRPGDKPGGSKPGSDKPGGDKPSSPKPTPTNPKPTPTDPKPSPTDPDPTPTNPKPTPTNPKPTPTPSEPVPSPSPSEPAPSPSDPACPDGTESDEASASSAETAADAEEPDPCPSDDEPAPTPTSSASSSPTATLPEEKLAPVDEQPEE